MYGTTISLYFKHSSKDKAEVFPLKLVSKELQHDVGKLIFMKQFLFFIINFQKEKANALTLSIILIVKSLQIELHSTNLLLWPQICQNKRAITQKFNNP